MKAADFRYECPQTLEQALSLIASLTDDNAMDFQALAGGQSLMPMMQLRVTQPEVLIDLNQLTELRSISESDGRVIVGAMTTYAELASSETIRQHVPLFTLALPHIAHQAVRNRGTIGGSCALADPAAEMPALLMALGATVVVVSVAGKRQIAAEDFFQGIYETALHENELVHSIEIPKADSNERFAFYELTRRHGDYAMAGIAVRLGAVNPVVEPRLVFFSVGYSAMRAAAAEQQLEGAELANPQQFTEALTRAQEKLSSLDYQGDLNATARTKAHLARVVLKRAIASLESGLPL